MGISGPLQTLVIDSCQQREIALFGATVLQVYRYILQSKSLMLLEMNHERNSGIPEKIR